MVAIGDKLMYPDNKRVNVDEIKQIIRDTLCDGELRLTDEHVAGIEEIEQSYLKQDFIHLIQ